MKDYENAIEIEGVSRSFGKTRAVSNLSMSVASGRIVGFLGPNGAGKTTTIKILVNVLRPDAGRISVLGLDPSRDALAIRQRTGYAAENHPLPRWMRVRDAFAFCRSFFPTWDEQLCERLRKLFQLDPTDKVKNLSKGTRVKLSLALALAHNPKLLILDEPMAGLDPLIREQLVDGILQTTGDQPRSILFSSHTFADVQRLADDVAIIHEGTLLVQSPVDDLLNKTKRIRAVLADGAAPEKNPPGMIWQRTVRREWLITVRDFSAEMVAHIRAENRIENVEVIDLSLEDIFKDFIRGYRGELCI